MMTNAECQHRADAYRLLAASFCEPELMMIEEDLLGNLHTVLSALSSDAAVPAADLGALLTAETIEETVVEYARLFIGPFTLVAPPYGSVYLEKGERVLGDSTLAVRKFYECEGLKLPDDFKDMPDHIAVELEFMSSMAGEYSTLIASDDPNASVSLNRQYEFARTFLLPWLTQFCDKVCDGSDLDIYKRLAQCLRTFCEEDAARMDAGAQEPKADDPSRETQPASA